MNVKEKVVMITGSNTGIGKETAILFAASGAKVIITYEENREEALEVKKICDNHTKVLLLKLDVRKEKSIIHAFEKVKNTFGSLDILINNAGVLIEKPFQKQNYFDIKQQVEVNLMGLIHITSAFLPLLQKPKEALVINVASRLSKKVIKNKSTYSATKFGVRGFTKALALELPKRIRSYCVNPGLTSTRMTNFHGVEPKRVAQIILKTAAESLGVHSGEDINVEELLSQSRN